MSTSSRRRPPKSPALPIDLEEIEQDPGFRGMLSFLEVSPEDRASLLAQRAVAEAQSPMGDTPPDQPPPGPISAAGRQLPLGQPPSNRPPVGEIPIGEAVTLIELPPGERSEVDSPEGHQPVGVWAEHTEPPPGVPPVGENPPAHLPVGVRRAVPYMEVEGRGKRPLRFCNTAQDGHTAGEQIVYQTLSNYARKFGRPEPSGSTLLDIGLSQLCSLLGADHKNVKRLIGSLQEKLAIEIVRQPDYRLAIPTRYRIFNYSQVLERRRAAGLQWVIRTRAVRFVDLATVNRLLAEQSVGEIPMDDPAASGGLPMGATPGPDPGQPPVFPAELARSLREFLPLDDAAVRQIWEACHRASPDCTEDEVLWFCRSKEPLIRSGRIDNPVALLIRSAPQFFANGGSTALEEYRRERAREQDRERKRVRRLARMVLDDPESAAAEVTWARELLASG